MPTSPRVAGPSGSIKALLRTGVARISGQALAPLASSVQDVAMNSDDPGVNTLQQRTEPQAAARTDSAVFHEEAFNADDFNFYELGDIYHDSTFDLLHFNVTGGLDYSVDLTDLGSVPAPAATSLLFSYPSDAGRDSRSSCHPLNTPLPEVPLMGMRTPTPSQLSNPEHQSHNSPSLRS
jgi:hypothetical protein